MLSPPRPPPPVHAHKPHALRHARRNITEKASAVVAHACYVRPAAVCAVAGVGVRCGGVSINFFIYFFYFFLSSGGWGKIKL